MRPLFTLLRHGNLISNNRQCGERGIRLGTRKGPLSENNSQHDSSHERAIGFPSGSHPVAEDALSSSLVRIGRIELVRYTMIVS